MAATVTKWTPKTTRKGGRKKGTVDIQMLKWAKQDFDDAKARLARLAKTYVKQLTK